MNKEVILEFLKKNVLSLSCAVVAILAIVAAFYPIGGMVTKLQADADDRAQLYPSLNNLTKSRGLPISDPYQTENGELKIFPNSATIAAGTKANALWKLDSEQMLKDLSETNHTGHTLLVPDELPNPQSESTQFYFPRLYKLVLSVDPAVTAIGNPNATPPIARDEALAAAGAKNLQNDILHGGLPPSETQISDAKASLWENKYVPMIQLLNGQQVNMPELQSEFQNECVTLPQKLKFAAADKFKIYVEKDAFSVIQTIQPEVKTPLADIWYAQMSIWIQQDLCNAIAEANDQSKNVLESPIKRLMVMQVPPAPMYTFAADGGFTPQPGSLSGGPSPLTDTNPIPPIYTVSASGRYSNAMYDVVPFKLLMDVDASKVNQIIETLSHGRLITVNGESAYAINNDSEATKGYVYGNTSVVRIQLECEILFMRSWTTPLMPERVKTALGLVTTAAPPAMGGPPPGPPMPGPGQIPYRQMQRPPMQ